MANIKAVAFFAPKLMPGDGCAVFLNDKVSLASAPAVGDVLQFKLPAGLELTELSVQCDDLDTNGSPTLAFSVGYAPYEQGSTLVAAPAAFAAAGQVTARTGGRLLCSFKPITFNEEVIITVTIGTAAATFAAGEVHVIAAGNANGPK